MDRFLEEIVVKKNRTVNEILFVLSMVVMILTATVCGDDAAICFSTRSLCLRLIMTLLLNAGIAVALFLFRDRLRTEYEYTFTNGDLDFAMVFNNQQA